MSISSALVTFLAIGAIHWFAIEARWAKPRAKEGYTEYPISMGLRLLLSSTIALLTYGSIANLFNPEGETWVSILLIGVVGFCFYFTPATILSSTDKLICIRWYGLRTISMNWSDVVCVYLDRVQNSLTIRDKFDRTIVHTMYNIGQADFLRQISELPFSFQRLV